MKFMPEFLDIYRHLQAQCRTFPELDTVVIEKELIEKLDCFKNREIDFMRAIKDILKETCI